MIFVIGMPRSGTTLVEQILASHPDVHGAGELMDFRNTVRNNLAIVSDPRFETVFANATADDFARAGRQYLDIVQALAPESRVITDKMPANALYAGLIPVLLPGAKIVLCHRDPMAICFSIYMRLFSTGQAFGYDQTELGTYFRLHQNLMAHWHTVMPGQLYDIHYENLVRSPEEEIRQLLNFCDLDWSDNCLNFHSTERSIKTASVTQVRKPIYKDSVQAWRRYEDHLKPLLDALGDAATGLETS